ncbi:MAG: molybdopterin molybdotransferase MoeA [Actinomycetaceae bacterium]|nr:molybdopterin molybdotransferase MoeA [Actinomycetaceae bacterium]MDY6082728.1 molybdopterin molybdotransferase MoeA [Actinomycetaceae bacterium]
MKTLQEQSQECLAVSAPLPVFGVELADASGCILADDVHSIVNIPAQDLAATDGYAIRAKDVFGASHESPVSLPVVAEIQSDDFDRYVYTENTAILVSSGAQMPRGADCVVPLELTDRGQATVRVFEAVDEHENVRTQAEDVRAGDVLVAAGTRISSRHIALVASGGQDRVTVRPNPRVVVMSIGDDIVEAGKPLPAGKRYDADSYAIAAGVVNAGGVPYRVGCVSDDKQVLREAIEDQLVRADVIITTGGLSYGASDTLRDVLAELGSVRFDALAMEPVHRMGVGTLEDGIRLFCLPGEPVAAMVAFDVFVRPALRKMQGYQHVQQQVIRAHAERGFASPQGKDEFVRVRVHGDPISGYGFTVQGENSRPLLRSLSQANGLAHVPMDVTTVGIGDELDCMIFAG